MHKLPALFLLEYTTRDNTWILNIYSFNKHLLDARYVGGLRPDIGGIIMIRTYIVPSPKGIHSVVGQRDM